MGEMKEKIGQNSGSWHTFGLSHYIKLDFQTIQLNVSG